MKGGDGTLESLGEELHKYLREAGGKLEKEEEAHKEPGMLTGISEPFTSILKGFKEVFGAFKPERKAGQTKLSYWEATQEKEAAGGMLRAQVYLVYDIFKKGHGMLSP